MNSTGSAAGIILAAGASARFAPFKAAALIRGKPLLHHCLKGLRGVCSQLIVVGGNSIDALRPLLEIDDFGPVELVENAGWAGGMFTSVKAGIRRVRDEAAFVLPVDCPLVPPGVFRRLLEAPGPAVVPAFQGRRGHPVLVRRQLFCRILEEPDGSSLRDLLACCGVVELSVDAREVLLDIDTPEDLAGLDGASTPKDIDPGS